MNLHPEADGISPENVACLNELDWLGQRIMAINAIEPLLGDGDQRLMMMRARSMYAHRARNTLAALSNQGFDWPIDQG